MIKRILLNILALFFRLIPRNKHLWVTGKVVSWYNSFTPPAFFDNSKYFFLYLVNHTDEEVYWLSSSETEINMLKNMGLPVVRFPSLKAIILVLRAKYSFHHYGTDQINSILQRGSVQLDFWHGTPLKKIRYDVVPKEPEKHNLIKDWENKNSVEFVSSTSDYLSNEILMHAFDVPKEALLNFGYPRMDVIGLNKDDNFAFCEKYSPQLVPYIKTAQRYKKVFLYMPTFRDDDPDYFEKANIDFGLLSKELSKIDGVFFLKLHPLTRNSKIESYENIRQINNDVDIYPFLIYTDYLITDYSSIFFDYLPLDKEIIFIPYDYSNYISHRELYFDYNEITPGKKHTSFEGFINELTSIDELDYSEDRERIRSLFIENYNFDACKNTYEYIKEKFK